MSRLLKVFIATLVLHCFLALEVKAEELDSLRLFYDPIEAEANTDQLNPSPVLPEKSPLLPRTNYVYNGYMSSEGGEHFIINGINLSDLTLLELVLVSDSGRTLKLRTINGFVFTLVMGEAMSVDPMLVGSNTE